MSKLTELQDQLPPFSQISPQDILPTIRKILEKNREKLVSILTSTQTYHWDNLMQPLEEMGDELMRYWSPARHLYSVMETEALRQAYNDCMPLLTAYYTELAQNEKLYAAILALSHQPDYAKLHPAQQKIISNDLRDFKLSGVNLPADKKERLAELLQQLSQLTTKFSENLLDATHGWILHIEDETQLAGLPPHALELAKSQAAQRKMTGYVLTLEYPSYSTGIKFLQQRPLRQKLYEAYMTRASDQGPDAGKWDNAPIMAEILKVRYEMAQLVGFANYAEYSLATKMAKTPEQVIHFLHELLVKARPVAEKELAEVKKIAQADGITHFEAWDLAYYSEKLRMAQYNFSEEDIRPYFPIQKVFAGLFKVVNTLFGITIHEEKNIDAWHESVQFFTIYDENQQLRGGFYTDLYARPHKRDGAWMDDCIGRRKLADGSLQYPVAFLTCNFMPPVGQQPALLSHDEVLTLFHEFGHCLHHMMTQVDYAAVAGINGVPWDAVEFPSQFMEGWCLEQESIALVAEHFQTGAPLPENLFQKLQQARHFQSGLQFVRQLELALFDFRLYQEYTPEKTSPVLSTLESVRKETALLAVPAFNRFQNSFSHIFTGGYAAGYYSYKWAEVLSADAFALFEENRAKGGPLFDVQAGRAFLKNILESGGVRDPMANFIAFRGREPTVDALLRQSGLIS